MLYHLTARSNVDRIRASGGLVCAADLLRRAGRADLIRRKRKDGVSVLVSGTQVCIRDQKPLHAGNCAFPIGWDFEDLVELLNEYVYFWPGTEHGPSEYGLRHFKRYEGEDVSILRLRFEDLARANPATGPLFSRYNSGAPRYSAGKASPRGPDTFRSPNEFGLPPSSVVEVAFRRSASLPGRIEIAKAGNWAEL
jgi:hypothetical protein